MFQILAREDKKCETHRTLGQKLSFGRENVSVTEAKTSLHTPPP